MRAKPEIRKVPVSGVEAHMGAIVYLAVLVYPDRKDWVKRNELVEAIRAHFCKAYIARGGSRRKMLPKYRQMKNENIGGILSRATYRLQARRLPAAAMAYWKILHGQQFGPIVLKLKPPRKREYWARKFSEKYPSWEPSSLNHLATLLAAELENARTVLGRHNHKDAEPLTGPKSSMESASKNVLHRVWKDTSPVLHLAMAFPKRESELGMRSYMLWLVHDPSWLLSTLTYAEALRILLPQYFPLYDPGKAVRLLPLTERV